MLRNLIGVAAVLLAIPALAVAAGSGAGSAPSMNTGPIAAAAAPLVPTHQPAAVYPTSAVPYGVEGNVAVCYAVQASGSVTGAHVTNSKFWTMNGQQPAQQGEMALRNAAISTVQGWQYAPRSFDGQAVPTTNQCATIRFRLGQQQTP